MQAKTKQVEEARDRWSWVERSVWNKRVLEALENGVKGGKWFSLIDIGTGAPVGAGERVDSAS